MVMRTTIITASLVLAILTSNSFALIGPPTAGLYKGLRSAGVNYLYSSTELETIKDLKINRYYGSLGYGILDTWEVFGQFGIADIKAQYPTTNDAYGTRLNGHNFDNDFAWGAGTRITFAKQDKVDWGAALQVNFLNAGKSKKFKQVFTNTTGTITQTGKEFFDIDSMDILITVGPAIDMGEWEIYGGPFYQHLSIDQDYRKVNTIQIGDVAETFTNSEHTDTDINRIGGYIGARFYVSPGCRTSVEFFGTGEDWGLSAGVEVPF
jgi:hypothetical protein